MNIKPEEQMIRQLIVICFFVLFIFGCGKSSIENEQTSTTMKPEGYLTGSSDPASAPNTADNYTAGELEPLSGTGLNPLAADTSSDEYRMTYGRSTAPLFPVFFDFDSSAINEDQLDNLNSSGEHLLENKSIAVLIEGNCDNRGTTDYNLALGELRALNVKKYLANIGVDENRLSTTSYGSQRPLYTDENEASWSMNRRADLVIQ